MKVLKWLLVLLQAYVIVGGRYLSQDRSLADMGDKPGYISIDCGATKPYRKSNISYDTDEGYIATGNNMLIDPNLLKDDNDDQAINTLRSFPEGERNCYTLKPANAKNTTYLIRARFMYGNYDRKNITPKFDIYIGVNFWDTIRPDSKLGALFVEIIYKSMSDFIYVCLVNSGSGTPFISELLLRPLDDSLYNVSDFALLFTQRYVTGIEGEVPRYTRYMDDVYDRYWSPLPRKDFPDWATYTIDSNLSSFRNDEYKLPLSIFKAGAKPRAKNRSLNYLFKPRELFAKSCFYLHFAETQKIGYNESREFEIFIDGKPMEKPIKLRYLEAITLASSQVMSEPVGSTMRLLINQTEASTLSPIINALEIYTVLELPQSATNQDDVNALIEVKTKYEGHKLLKSWQGDPCLPKLPWEGLICSNNGNDSPTITSLNLSSRSLKGEILPSLFSLKSLSCLILSNNNLTGAIPEFLAEMPSLQVIDLSGNKLSGPVPIKLANRAKNGLLALRLEGNPDLCSAQACRTSSKNHVLLNAVVTTSSFVLLIAITFAAYCVNRAKAKATEAAGDEDNDEDEELDLPFFPFNMIVHCTDNFSKANKLGEGGFGSVYKGVLEGGQEIAVKRLSHNSKQGQKEFKNEVKCIAKLQHRNLVKLIGYCNEKEEQLLIYEFMPNKSLDVFIFDKTRITMDWSMRFEIIYGIARGLVYLHQDSRMRIIHRDLKASNVLLDHEMKPKISDFGMARMFDGEESTAKTKRVVGTYGYMSPEYAVDGVFSVKSDVFSFGVLVLEIVSGQRNRAFVHTDDLNLLGHAWRLFTEGAALDLVDQSIKTLENEAQILRTIHIGLLCVQEYAEDRPSMSLVILMLSGESKLPWPKQPGFFVRRHLVKEESASLSSGIGSSFNRESITLLSPR